MQYMTKMDMNTVETNLKSSFHSFLIARIYVGVAFSLTMPLVDPELNEKIDGFISDLKQSKMQGSYGIACKTVQLLRVIISSAKWGNAHELLNILKEVGKRMIEAEPSEAIVCNMVRRVLYVVREEYERAARGKAEEGAHPDSLHNLLTGKSDEMDLTTSFSSLKTCIMEALQELMGELESSAENIATQALEHLHSNEVIMTMGKCKTVQMFLQKAGKKRKFHVIVVETAPLYNGHELATSLANAGIETTVITDSAIFAMMSRVNKVIIGTRTMMANGGLKAFSGSHTLALAAKHHSVPLIVCAAMYKLSPQFLAASDQLEFNTFRSPEEVLGFSEGEVTSKVQICNPVYDYVPPELVTLFISNLGGNSPSYVYRLLSELYHPSDQDLGVE